MILIRLVNYIPQPIRRPILFLVAPFIMLVRGRFIGLMFTLLFMLLCWNGCVHGDRFLFEYATFLDKTPGFPSWIVPYFHFALRILLYFLFIPASIVAVILPLRVQYLGRGRFNFVQLLVETPGVFVQCARSFIYLLHSQLISLIPFGVLIGLYFYSAEDPHLSTIRGFYIIGMVVAFLMVARKTLSIILTPIIVVIGRYTAEGALQTTMSIVNGALFRVCLLILFGAAILTGNLYLPEVLGISFMDSVLLQIFCGSLAYWYALTLIGIFCIQQINQSNDFVVDPEFDVRAPATI